MILLFIVSLHGALHGCTVHIESIQFKYEYKYNQWEVSNQSKYTIKYQDVRTLEVTTKENSSRLRNMKMLIKRCKL